jgi:hypothetical protein
MTSFMSQRDAEHRNRFRHCILHYCKCAVRFVPVQELIWAEAGECRVLELSIRRVIADGRNPSSTCASPSGPIAPVPPHAAKDAIASSNATTAQSQRAQLATTPVLTIATASVAIAPMPKKGVADPEVKRA